MLVVLLLRLLLLLLLILLPPTSSPCAIIKTYTSVLSGHDHTEWNFASATLTPWSRVITEMLIVSQRVNKVPAPVQNPTFHYSPTRFPVFECSAETAIVRYILILSSYLHLGFLCTLRSPKGSPFGFSKKEKCVYICRFSHACYILCPSQYRNHIWRRV
jgi:hypothetical protein